MKTGSILSFALLLSLTSYAQNFHLGAKGGLNISRALSESFTDKGRLSFNAGGYLSYNFSRPIGIQAEVLYNRLSLRTNLMTAEDASGIGPGAKRLNYLSIPLLLKLDVGSLFSVLVGPQINSLQNSSKYKLNNGERAYDTKNRISYAVGIDMESLYFRYVWNKNGFGNALFTDEVNASQFQIGFRIKLL